ncbi:MAG TPA: phenylalanine--tRNA ligase subunit beta [Xanthobacteraceae bacterium]|nr:phenylalanine--tRNA ligase subunit beta [Xanthobacteraceae bacterium]
MKFTLSWLKDHLDTDASLEAIVHKLTMIGLEVEHVEDKAKALSPFTIARVISAEQHPNADRLRVCMVDTGSGDPVQVVCGAPNARAGMKGVFSPPGTFIPGKNITLGVGTIRGVESRGMLCSGFELQLSDDHEGILDLPPDAPVGVRYAEWALLDDPVVEINLTPNRPDCAGIHGVARDLAAADVGKFKDAAIKPIAGAFPCPVGVTLDFGASPSLCRGFALRLVRGVKNGPSPDWLRRRLSAIGLRPINALVDITNYITYDRGRPLHVFDAAKVKGDLVVRRARAGESLLALDGRTYTLDDSMCVIADEHGVESLAGIMGGEAGGCSEATIDVLIESALWDEINIAHTGRKLNITSDARYRFERGVDPAFMVPGLELATQMVLNICGGTPSAITSAGEVDIPDRVIEFPLDEVKRLAGIELRLAEIKRVLSRLGFSTTGARPVATADAPVIKVTVPTWRPDVHGKADIVEEIVRIVGVDRVPMTPFERGDSGRKPVLTVLQNRTRKARRALAARGLVEAVTWSFVSRPQAELFGGGKPELALANPIAADLSDMRPSLVPGLVAAAQKNADRGYVNVALFEVGQIFRGDHPEDQFVAASAMRRGLAKASGWARHWATGGKPVDAFDVKADALAVLAAAGAPMSALQTVPGGPSWLHPGRSGTIQIGPQNVLGYFGELHPRSLEALGAEGPLVAFEVILDRIPEPKARPTRAKPPLELSPFQPVERDFAFIVDRAVKAGDLVRAAQGAERKLIAGIAVFDVYEGAGIDPDKKSVAIAVTLQPREKTLTDLEIDAVSAKIVTEVGKRVGGVLRG